MFIGRRLKTLSFLTKIMLYFWMFMSLILYNQGNALDYIKHQTVSEQNVSTACTTPNNQTGVCLSLKNCPPLFELFKSYVSIRNESISKYLRLLKCGTESKTGYPKVCCFESPSSSSNQSSQSSSQSSPSSSQSSQSSSPYDSSCGISTYTFPKTVSGIVGGTNSSLGNWPWIASLYYRNNYSTSDSKPRCTGSLISKDWVVTAAHCFINENLTLSWVRLGDINLNDDVEDGATPINVLVDEIIVHPQFSIHPLINDVALIRLKHPVSFSTYIRPICLMNGTEEFKNDAYYLWKNIFVVGFGRHLAEGDLSTALQHTDLFIVQNKECAKNYRGHNAVIDNRVLCAKAPGRDSCQGASGGPLALGRWRNNGSRWNLIGIVSFGVGCGDPNFPGVYTKVAQFSEWISNMTGIPT